MQFVTYIFARVGVVEEAVSRGRTVGQVHSKLELEGLSEHVGTRVPESFSAGVVTELEKPNFAVTLQRARCVIIHPAFSLFALLLFWVLKTFVKGSNAAIWVAHLGHDDLLCELTGDHLGHVERCRLKRGALLGLSVGQGHSNWLFGHLSKLLSLLSVQGIPVGIPFVDKSGSLLELPVSANDLDFFVASNLVTCSQLGSFAFFSGVRGFGGRCRRTLGFEVKCFSHNCDFNNKRQSTR